MKDNVRKLLENMTGDYPQLGPVAGDVAVAFGVLAECYRNKGKLLVCGNGGSAADAEHITGELMKEFLLKRRMTEAEIEQLAEKYGDRGREIGHGLQHALPAISLVSQSSLFTAFANDVNVSMVFAQQVYGYGRPGDVLLAISTSGNSLNVCNAAIVAGAYGLAVVGLTGDSGGELADRCDVTIRVPAEMTPRIQELHEPVYHCLCAMLEQEFFGGQR